jgi:hypothetical protein
MLASELVNLTVPCVTEASAMPSSGYYIAGHFVVNTSQSAQRDGILGFSTTRRVAVSGTIAAADTLYLYPFFVPSTWTFTGGRARTITGGAGSAIKTAIYANETTSGQMAISLPERLWQLITPGRLPPK